jgi:hypothetical protein
MAKKLNQEEIMNELSGSSFFRKADSPIKDEVYEKEYPTAEDKSQLGEPETAPPSSQDTVIPRYHDVIFEDIRSALKAFGKEAATHRFTATEKAEVADIIYEYGKKGIRTSENEITRIAVNFVIQDLKEFGDESILDTILKLLHK